MLLWLPSVAAPCVGGASVAGPSSVGPSSVGLSVLLLLVLLRLVPLLLASSAGPAPAHWLARWSYAWQAEIPRVVFVVSLIF